MPNVFNYFSYPEYPECTCFCYHTLSPPEGTVWSHMAELVILSTAGCFTHSNSCNLQFHTFIENWILQRQWGMFVGRKWRELCSNYWVHWRNWPWGNWTIISISRYTEQSKIKSLLQSSNPALAITKLNEIKKTALVFKLHKIK